MRIHLFIILKCISLELSVQTWLIKIERYLLYNWIVIRVDYGIIVNFTIFIL